MSYRIDEIIMASLCVAPFVAVVIGMLAALAIDDSCEDVDQ